MLAADNEGETMLRRSGSDMQHDAPRTTPVNGIRRYALDFVVQEPKSAILLTIATFARMSASMTTAMKMLKIDSESSKTGGN